MNRNTKSPNSKSHKFIYLTALFLLGLAGPLAIQSQTYLDDKVNESTKSSNTSKASQAPANPKKLQKAEPTLSKKARFFRKDKETASNPTQFLPSDSNDSPAKPNKAEKPNKNNKAKISNQKTSKQEDSVLAPVKAENDSSDISVNKESSANQQKELQQISKERQKNTKKTIDAINFIQPSLALTQQEQQQVDLALTRAEQEQLTILWRATLERNKTIRFIVEKLTPDSKTQKKNQILSQVLNTAIFLPFYALQTVAPTDTSALASYVGAGLAGDIINGRATKNSDKMQLSQTEMVIMFMMIDQVAERVRDQFHVYKQEKVDEVLAISELEDAKSEAAASLDSAKSESKFLSQVRIRQIERELRRISYRARSARIVLVDLSGPEAVDQTDKLMNKEMKAVLELPSTASTTSIISN